ncbi:MAG: 4-alpha-glucanotransferase [Clostridia bacterium]|nr:4-alpha-glucanotransferase [Clostridia bacterium]
MAKIERSAGILCHISSLPGKYGIGSLGKEAYEFCDFLHKSHIKYWQILPLAQTGYGDSPYQSVCVNSGNPYFIDLEDLRNRNLLTEDELAGSEMPDGPVDYGTLYRKRYETLRKAYSRFNTKDQDFLAFMKTGEFEDYALFMSLKSLYLGTWDTFPDSYKYRESLALSEFKENVYKTDYCFWLFLQYVFEEQWAKLKDYANSLGIRIIGDIPLYVANDSADAWANPELFQLDEDLKPRKVAGVPPDYFSPTGQLWGNVLYDWDEMEKRNFDWWKARIRKASTLYDGIRFDHFRGLDRYYSIPYGDKTAENGKWVPGPGMKLFNALKEEMDRLDVIAEDLGNIDDGVIKLKEDCGYPGMAILLFAFDGHPDNSYLPANITSNTVIYTGTHDNDTALGFLRNMTTTQLKIFKKRLRAALKSEGEEYPFVTREETVNALIVCALSSKADLAVLPIQDVLGLDNSCRMNTPAVMEGNWRFRLSNMPTRVDAAYLRLLVKRFRREPKADTPPEDDIFS